MYPRIAQDSNQHSFINSSLSPHEFGLSVTRDLVNKRALRTPVFQNTVFTVNQLAAHLQAGYAICGALLTENTRRTTHVLSIQVLGVDFDTLSCEQALQHPFVHQYAAIVYATPSSTPANPRSRALFVLGEPVTREQHAVYVHRVLALFGRTADSVCSDPVRIWYGSTQPDYCVRDCWLPVDVLDALPDPPAPTTPTVALTLPTRALEPADLQAVYRAHSVHGRNSALFAASLYARDHGVPHTEASRALVDMFADSAPLGHHAPENRANRVLEGTKTVSSAYSRPPRISDRNRTEIGLLPNLIRERLMQHKLTSVARVLEILSTEYAPGEQVRCADAVRLCAGFHVSNKTVRSVFEQTVRTVDTASGELSEQRIFTRVDPQCSLNRNGVKADSLYATDRVNQGVKINHNTSQRGRKSIIYVMPGIHELARILHIELASTQARHSDPLPVSAYASAQAYRMAMYAAFLVRSENTAYSRALLSGRLGISKRTLAVYDRKLGVQKTVQTTDTVITWKNAQHILDDESRMTRKGIWLTDGTRRYPPKLSVAFSLLATSVPVRLCVQGASLRRLPASM